MLDFITGSIIDNQTGSPDLMSLLGIGIFILTLVIIYFFAKGMERRLK